MSLGRPRLLAIGIAALALTVMLTAIMAAAAEPEQTIRITAKRFEYSPKEITVKKGAPVALEFTSLDRLHGFDCPGLNIRSDIPPKKVTTLRFVPRKAGVFPFHCDVFCGSGHEEMMGTITVTE